MYEYVRVRYTVTTGYYTGRVLRKLRQKVPSSDFLVSGRGDMG